MLPINIIADHKQDLKFKMQIIYDWDKQISLYEFIWKSMFEKPAHLFFPVFYESY